MSEYQYFKFQAVDRSLTENEMQDLRQAHSRKPTLIERLRKAGLW